MITKNNLDCLVDKLEEIKAIVKKYKLEEFSLLQPADEDRQKLYFVMSKKNKENQKLTFEEVCEIKGEIFHLWEAEGYSEDVVVDVRENYRERYFDQGFKNVLPIQENTSREKVVSFIQENLNTKYTHESVSSIQEETKAQFESDANVVSPNNNVCKEPDSSVEIPSSAKKVSSHSSIFFHTQPEEKPSNSSKNTQQIYQEVYQKVYEKVFQEVLSKTVKIFSAEAAVQRSKKLCEGQDPALVRQKATQDANEDAREKVNTLASQIPALKIGISS